MALISPNRSDQVAREIQTRLASGQGIEQVLRSLFAEGVGALLLKQALQKHLGISSREAAATVVKEVLAQLL